MRLFSHRQGYRTYGKAIQRESVDAETRNRLWTLLKVHVWDRWEADRRYDQDAQAVEDLLDLIWFRYFKRPSDTRPRFLHTHYHERDCYNVLRTHFFETTWYGVYDFLEFVIAHIPVQLAMRLSESVNIVLTEENAAYRILSGHFAPITNEAEIASVAEAAAAEIDGVHTHINRAIQFLSDRKTPDYRNSIKESISAVESLMIVLSGKKAATLSDGLKRVDAVISLHPALKLAFEKLYAYSSDEDGVRHAIVDGTKVSHGDAKFFLVSCSAFINYVSEKFAEQQKQLSWGEISN